MLIVEGHDDVAEATKVKDRQGSETVPFSPHP